MKKSGKLSTSKVAVTPGSKSVKQGKREAVETKENLASAKRQKKENGVEKITKKDVVELRTPKKTKKESSSSEEFSSSDEEVLNKVAVPSRKQQPLNKNALVPAKKGNVDRSASDSLDDESDDKEERPIKLGQPVSIGNGNAGTPAKIIMEESNCSDSSSEEEEEVTPVKRSAPQVPVVVAKSDTKPSNESAESSDDSVTDESSDGEKKDSPAKVAELPPKDPVTQVQQKKNSDESNPNKSTDENLDQPKSKKDTDVEMVDAKTPEKAKQDAKEDPENPFESQSPGKKTLYIRNLSFKASLEEVKEFFKAAGEVVDVRFHNAEQKAKGYGHVQFANAEAAQRAFTRLNGEILCGRNVFLDFAHERTPKSKSHNSSQKGEKERVKRICVRGFDRNLGVDEIKHYVAEHFKTCGEISKIEIPKKSGAMKNNAVKGCAYLDFKYAHSSKKALELGNENLIVEEAQKVERNRGKGKRERRAN